MVKRKQSKKNVKAEANDKNEDTVTVNRRSVSRHCALQARLRISAVSKDVANDANASLEEVDNLEDSSPSESFSTSESDSDMNSVVSSENLESNDEIETIEDKKVMAIKPKILGKKSLTSRNIVDNFAENLKNKRNSIKNSSKGRNTFCNSTVIDNKKPKIEPTDLPRTNNSLPKENKLRNNNLFNYDPSITNILLATESKKNDNDEKNKPDENITDDSDEWEEVNHNPNKDFSTENLHISDDIHIKIDEIGGKLKHKSKRQRALEWAQYCIHKYKIDSYVWMHKVHLLTFIAHGYHLNFMTKSTIFEALSLSLKNSCLNLKFSPSFIGKCDSSSFDAFVKKLDIILPQLRKNSPSFENKINCVALEECFQNGYARNIKEYILSRIGIIKAIGFKIRLILSVYPIYFREKIPKCHQSNIKQKKPNEKKKVIKNVRKKNSRLETESKYFVDGPSDEKKKIRNGKKKQKKIPVLSSDDESICSNKEDNEENNAEKQTIVKQTVNSDLWCEVYLPKEKKWICVDFKRCKINCEEEMENECCSKLSYVLCFYEDNTVKDLTEKYASKFNVNNRKLRGDHKWWEETLEILKPRNNSLDEIDNKTLKDEISKMPSLPYPCFFGV